MTPEQTVDAIALALARRDVRDPPGCAPAPSPALDAARQIAAALAVDPEQDREALCRSVLRRRMRRDRVALRRAVNAAVAATWGYVRAPGSAGEWCRVAT